MRLQVPLLVGLVVDPLVPTKEPQESTTVTPAEIIYHRRVRVLDRAGQTSVTEACRTFGISRTTYYRWAGRAQRSGLAALLPKSRRPPVMPTATPPDQVEAVLAEAVARPTIGARRLVEHLAERGVRLSASGVQKILRRHRLGRRAQRVAALAQLTAATTGILTTAAKEGPFGFCHFAARPGDLVALGAFYVGKLKGVGPVWQLTAVDTATRYAIGALVAGDKSARNAVSFVDHVAARLAGIGVELTGVLTDNGPEFTAKTFTSHLAHLGVGHHRIPPRSPTTTRSASASKGPRSRSSTGQPSTASTLLAWPTSTPSSRAGCRPTTPAVATTATSCVAARPLRSWRPTYHDQAEGPPVTSSRALEGLGPHSPHGDTPTTWPPTLGELADEAAAGTRAAEQAHQQAEAAERDAQAWPTGCGWPGGHRRCRGRPRRRQPRSPGTPGSVVGRCRWGAVTGWRGGVSASGCDDPGQR